MFYETLPTIQSAAAVLKQRKQGRPKSSVPSRRDQEIFKRVVVHCQRQYEVGADLKLTPSRVSQIVNRVRRWLAAGSQGDPETLAALERRRLELALAQARHEAIYERLIREADRQAAHPQQTTVRTEMKASGRRQPPGDSATEDAEVTKVITTVRDQPLDVQLLKAAQRSAIELERLAEREPIPAPRSSAMPSDNELFLAIYDILCDWRRRAEHAGKVTKSCNVPAFIQHLLAAALRRDHGHGLAHDPAVREAVRSLAIGSLPPDLSQQAEQLVAEVEQAIPKSPVQSPKSPQAGSDLGPSTLDLGPPDIRPSAPHFAHVEPAALADKLIQPKLEPDIPNPLLFLGSDESLPPVPPPDAPSPADQKTENLSANPATGPEVPLLACPAVPAGPAAAPTPPPPTASSNQSPAPPPPPPRDTRIPVVLPGWAPGGATLAR